MDTAQLQISASDEKVKKKLEQVQAQNGVKAPSDIAQALADETGPAENPKGFVGKFLKKHRDLKLKAQEEVARVEKEKHDRLV